jgi:ribosomal protein S6
MAKKTSSPETTPESVEAGERRVYELGYLAVSTLSESHLTEAVDSVRKALTDRGGSIISEDAPHELLLAYTMYTRSQEKNIPHDKAFFGSIKFEILPREAEVLRTQVIPGMASFIRTMLYTTVAEDTRAKVVQEKLKEVKASGTIGKATKAAKSAVTESELDKTVDDIVADIV